MSEKKTFILKHTYLKSVIMGSMFGPFMTDNLQKMEQRDSSASPMPP